MTTSAPSIDTNVQILFECHYPRLLPVVILSRAGRWFDTEQPWFKSIAITLLVFTVAFSIGGDERIEGPHDDER